MAVPETLKQYLPEKGLEIKEISGYYYVYKYSAKKLSSGKWGKSSGQCIGKVVEGKGFIPNKSYKADELFASVDEITVLEYGQYGLIYTVAAPVLKKLEQYFKVDVASQIFSYAALIYANGFIHVDQVNSFYQQSWLSLKNKKLGISMGRTAISTLLDDLARKGTRVHNYEQSMIADCITGNAKIAIDGHGIRSMSDENDFAETGYKFKELKADQINLLMGYDVEKGIPLFAKLFRGSAIDKSTIEDLDKIYDFKNILFIIDRGFFSTDNLNIFSKNGCTFIIPLPANTNEFKKAMNDLSYTGEFMYRAGKKHTRVQYMERVLSDGRRVIVYKDTEENERTRFNYLRSIDQGKAGYTQEEYEKNKDLFGVIVLFTNTSLSPEEVFCNYKKRWSIETFYQFLKNTTDFNNLKIEDYYKEQGLAFIMLITGQIHHYVELSVKKLQDNTTSIYDALTMARFMKINLIKKKWHLCNTRKKDLERLKVMGFEPTPVVA